MTVFFLLLRAPGSSCSSFSTVPPALCLGGLTSAISLLTLEDGLTAGHARVGTGGGGCMGAEDGMDEDQRLGRGEGPTASGWDVLVVAGDGTVTSRVVAVDGKGLIKAEESRGTPSAEEDLSECEAGFSALPLGFTVSGSTCNDSSLAITLLLVDLAEPTGVSLADLARTRVTGGRAFFFMQAYEQKFI
jgi:hypothetical protein